MRKSLLENMWACFCAAVLEMCAKLRVNGLNRFRTGPRQVFTIFPSFLNEIPLNMKTATSNFIYKDFLLNLRSLKLLLKCIFLFVSKLNILIPSGFFPFLVQLYTGMK